jgi:hypothetical protein
MRVVFCITHHPTLLGEILSAPTQAPKRYSPAMLLQHPQGAGIQKNNEASFVEPTRHSRKREFVSKQSKLIHLGIEYF